MKKDFIYIALIVSGLIAGCNPNLEITGTYSDNWYKYQDSINKRLKIDSFNLSIDTNIKRINSNIEQEKKEIKKHPSLKLDGDIYITNLKTCSVKLEIVKLKFAYAMDSLHTHYYN